MTTSSRLRRSLYSACFAVCTATIAAPAFAQSGQPSAADLESARELYKEAKALRDKGDLRGALERFKAAHQYGQTPVTALELGRTHMQLGELVEAREVLLSVGRMKVQPDETERSAAARTEAADLAEQIKGKIPTLVIKLSGVPAGTEPQVTVDGASVPVVSNGAVRKTNPGAHVVVARAGSREEKKNVDLKEGESRELPIAFTGDSAVAGGGSGGAGGGTPGADTTPQGKKVISPVTWIGLGVAVAGIGVGAVAGIVALGKAKTVKNECKGTSCPPAARDDVDAGRSAATFSTIGFAVGGAGLAVAAVGWFVLSKPETTASAPALGPKVRASFSPTGVVLDGVF